ncbi:MAG: hypothetical protein ABJL55_17955 [Roseibium sp.]
MTPSEFLNACFDGKGPNVDADLLNTLRLWPPLTNGLSDSDYRRLPARHKKLLELSDGMDLLEGSYRLFSWAEKSTRTMRWWNKDQTWKFAWRGRAADYYCFGESVLGNQFIYSLAELVTEAEPKVYEVYPVTMEPICAYDSFDHFLDGGFFNGVMDDDYHRRIAAARSELGSFDLSQHLAYMPSPLLSGGRVDVQLMPMTAEAHLTVNGDLFCELAHLQSLEGLQGLDNYEDTEGRLRVRPIWGAPLAN